MIRSCLFSRKELTEMIRKAPRTKDGYYFFPRFKVLILAQGIWKDNGYYYDRCFFKDQVCFNDEDIKLFNTKKRIACDIDLKHTINTKLNDVLKGLEFLELYDTIPGTQYNLEELIDTTAYIIKYKYS